MSGINFNVTDNQAANEDLVGASVDDLVALSGVAVNSLDLGTFTGVTIQDNATIKEALQDLETALEGVSASSLSSATDISVFLDDDDDTTANSFTVYQGVATPTGGNEIFQVANNTASFWGTDTNVVNFYDLAGTVAAQLSPDDFGLLAKEGSNFGIYASDDYTSGPGYSEGYIDIGPGLMQASVTYNGSVSATFNMQGSGAGDTASFIAGQAAIALEDPASGLQRAELSTVDTNARLRQVDGSNEYTPIFDLRVSTVQKFAVVKNGGVIVGRKATAASASTTQESIIGVTSTAAPRTITLDTDDCKLGRIVIIKDESGGAGTNNITVDTEGSELIDGAASVSITANYGVIRVYSDGSNWFSF